MLDLCTGNGSLAVLAALAWPGVRGRCRRPVSADALAVARSNVDRHGLADRITLRQGDGLAAVAGRRYDLILCNPPYVNARVDGRAARRSTAPSRRWPWPAATTAWTSSAPLLRACRART